MIHLTTGLPRNGKTLYTIAYVKKLAEKENRPVFYSGIEGVKLPWSEIDADKWYECPQGAIILIDECQRVFRPRGNGLQVPTHVSELETHGHDGHDLFLITQHPMLVDNNVRRLVERHWHVSRPNGADRATVLGFKGCQVEPTKKISDAERLEWPYPKDLYNVYESAKEHTVRRRLSMHVVMLWAAILGTVAMIGYMGYRFKTRAVEVPAPVVPTGQAPAHAPRFQPGQTTAEKKPMTEAEYLAAHQPRITGLAYTAPIYDEVTKPEEAPIPAACIESKKRGCKCYSQQATVLPMDDSLCHQIVANGYFQSFTPKSMQKDVAKLDDANQPAKPVEPESLKIASYGTPQDQDRMTLSPYTPLK